jgi:hypothetical protein
VEKEHTDILYATVTAENHVGLSVSAYSESITVDNTPPLPGIVVELSSVAKIDPNDVAKTVELNRKACSTEEGEYKNLMLLVGVFAVVVVFSLLLLLLLLFIYLFIY